MSAAAPGWKIWLAYRIGGFDASPHCHTSGRDALRTIRAYFDQMGVDESEWRGIEQAGLQNDSAIAISTRKVRQRVMEYLAGGECPLGPFDRMR